jgi:hypothetical protein
MHSLDGGFKHCYFNDECHESQSEKNKIGKINPYWHTEFPCIPPLHLMYKWSYVYSIHYKLYSHIAVRWCIKKQNKFYVNSKLFGFLFFFHCNCVPLWSSSQEFLAANPVVPGSIPRRYQIF